MNAHTDFAKTKRVQPLVMKDEVPFAAHELFFSRTDGRGVIETGNEVFQRIALHPWDKLLKAPHRIIRHPDMPRAVFWLLWETIKAGNPVGAFVKNLAADGRYYWVYAVVTPIDGGYLSVRLKPTSPLLAVVEKEYKALRTRELAENLEPAESAALLLDRLKEMGFRNYDQFMAHALAEELMSRDAAIGRTPSLEVRNFKKLMGIANRMLDEAAQIGVKYNTNRFVAFNMRVRAARMGGSGKTVGVISNDYGIHSRAMLEEMDGFAERARELAEIVAKGSFLFSTALLQKEAIAQFAEEKNLPESIDLHLEQAFLSKQHARYSRIAKEEVLNISKDMLNFARRTAEMQRLVSGLEVTRVMGMIECAHLRERGKALLDVLSDLEHFQREVSDILSQIDDANLDLFATIRQME